MHAHVPISYDLGLLLDFQKLAKCSTPSHIFLREAEAIRKILTITIKSIEFQFSHKQKSITG